MEYDDELERARMRKSRKRAQAPARSTGTLKSRSSGDGKRGQSAGNFGSGYRGPRQKKKDPLKSRRIKIIIGEVLVLIALLIFGAYSYVSSVFKRMNQEEFIEEQVTNPEISDEQKEVMEGYWTVACFGLDPRSGNLSDVNMLININRATGEIKLVSIFRDTYLNISEKNSYNKINSAYGQGGPTQAVAAINKNLGLNITEYASFSWGAVAQAINLLGGVDIEISEAEFYYINAFITETVKVTGIYSTQLKKPGLQHLDGVQAVAYGRLRLMDTDYARTERQRIVIQKAFEKAKQADWATLNNIIQTVLIPDVSTNVTANDIISLAWDIGKYHIGETAGFPFARGECRKVGKITDIVVPQTLESNVIQLHKFLYDEDDYVVPNNVKQISDHISEVTGMYTEGETVGHVRTDQGYVPKKSKTTNKGTQKTTEAETEETSESESESTLDPSQSLEGMTSSDGAQDGQNYPGPGDPRYPSGTYPGGSVEPGQTDSTSSGNPSGTVSPGNPTGTVSPGNPSGTDSPGNPSGTVSPGNPSGTVSPGNPTGTTSPGNPSGTTSPGSNPTTSSGGVVRPGQDATTAAGNGVGPGSFGGPEQSAAPTSPTSSTAASTAPAGPGGA